MSSFRGIAQRSTSYANKTTQAALNGYFEHIAQHKVKTYIGETTGRSAGVIAMQCGQSQAQCGEDFAQCGNFYPAGYSTYIATITTRTYIAK